MFYLGRLDSFRIRLGHLVLGHCDRIFVIKVDKLNK